jgi:hypothetical protein
MSKRKVHVYVAVCVEFELDDGGHLLDDKPVAAYVNNDGRPVDFDSQFEVARGHWANAEENVLCAADDAVSEALALLKAHNAGGAV